MEGLELKRIHCQMSALDYNCTEEWLVACIQWIKENYDSLSSSQLMNEIVDQWKDTNLEVMGTSCLPSRLSEKQVVTLNSKYCLQINAIEDIGESAYSQINKLRKKNVENTDVAATDSTTYKPSWEPKTKRCLYLTLTDGKQICQGLELTYIDSLSLKTPLGCKIVVSGPVQCRRGIIHLRNRNIIVIGGEIEALTENSYESILEKKINKARGSGSNPTNCLDHHVKTETHADSDIFGDDSLFMDIDEKDLFSTEEKAESLPANLHVQSSREYRDNFTPSYSPTMSFRANSELKTSQADRKILTNSAIRTIKKTVAETEVMKLPDIVDKTFQYPKITAAEQFHDRTASKPSGKQLSIDEFLKPMPAVIDPPTPIKQQFKRKRLADTDSDPIRQEIIPHGFSENSLQGFSSPSHIKHEASPSASSDRVGHIRTLPYTFLRQVKKNFLRFKQSGETFYVKACIVTLLSNIRVEQKQWSLWVCINDGSDFMDCKLSHDFLFSLLKFSPSQMKKIKTSGTEKDKLMMKQALASLTDVLINMNCLMAINLQPNPIVTSVKDMQINHDIALSMAVEDIKLVTDMSRV